MRFRSLSLNLPKEVRQQLNFTMHMLIDLLAENVIGVNPDGTIYVRKHSFTEWWIAERINRSREWVSKCMQKLVKLNIVEVIRDRRTDGKFGINTYRFSRYVLSLWGRWSQAMRRMKNSIQNHVKWCHQLVDNISSIYSFSSNSKYNCKKPYSQDRMDFKTPSYPPGRKDDKDKKKEESILDLAKKLFNAKEIPDEAFQPPTPKQEVKKDDEKKKDVVEDTLRNTVAELGKEGIRKLLEIDKKYFGNEVLQDLRDYLKRNGLESWIP